VAAPAPDVVTLARDLIRIDTSNPDATEEKAADYVVDVLSGTGALIDVVEPAPGRRSIVARLPGSDPDLPAVLVHGHLDVVPAAHGRWRHDPFAGDIAGGCLWGRGAVDMKGAVAMMLSAQLALAQRRARRTMIFAYFADEEMGGALGSAWIVRERPELLADAAFAIGEMGGFSVTLPNGRRVFPLQLAEKGMLWVRIVVPGTPGHAAFSSEGNAAVRAAALVQRVAALEIEDEPTPAFTAMLEQVARLAGATPADAPEVLGRLGAFGQAALRGGRTFFTPTVIHAGEKLNVIPGEATVGVDCRFVPGGGDRALAAIRSLLDDDMTCEVLTSMPGLQSPLDGEVVDRITQAIGAVDPEAAVLPYVLPAGTDAQHLAELGIQGYGFTPAPMQSDFDYFSMFHAVDERIPLDALTSGSALFTDLLVRLAG
jgi:acetylornithine deacetylase/succinyl-diaminopimelate desuccinylase-like protein